MENENPHESSDEAAVGGEPAVPDNDARLWATLAHLAALAGYIIPFVGNIVGPLVVWLIKKDESPFVDHHGKEAVNFQISMTIYVLAAAVSLFFLIGFVLVPVLVILQLVFMVIAAIAANKGEYYKYPMTIRLIN